MGSAPGMFGSLVPRAALSCAGALSLMPHSLWRPTTLSSPASPPLCPLPCSARRWAVLPPRCTLQGSAAAPASLPGAPRAAAVLTCGGGLGAVHDEERPEKPLVPAGHDRTLDRRLKILQN